MKHSYLIQQFHVLRVLETHVREIEWDSCDVRLLN